MDPIRKSPRKVQTRITLQANQIFLTTSIAMELLLISNIIWSCSSTFPCSDFLPTISYLACFRGHDRLFSFTMTFWSGNLAMFFVLSYNHYRSSSRFNNLFCLISLVICLVQPGIAILDEANTSYFVKIEKIHSGFMIGLFLASMVWIYLTSLGKGMRSALIKYINLLILCACWSFLQWFYEDSNNFWFNYKVEAISEWITVTLAVFTPYMYSIEFGEVAVDTRTHKR